MQEMLWIQLIYKQYATIVHDSTAFKTELYQQIHTLFDLVEYVFADKAYAPEGHVITPHKEPASRERTVQMQHLIGATSEDKALVAQFYYLSWQRRESGHENKIEHAFGVLKARWPTLYNIPVCIDNDKERGARE